MYISYPPGRNTSSKALLHITDIFGVPLLQNKLLADSLAANDYLVVMPDLFAGDAISVEEQEAGLNLTEWRALHPTSEIDRIVNTTIEYMRSELEVEKIGGLGFCFGGKYVPRFLTGSGGMDLGFIAHPSSLTEAEIMAIRRPLSLAAGSKLYCRGGVVPFGVCFGANPHSARRFLQRDSKIACGKHPEDEQHYIPVELVLWSAARLRSQGQPEYPAASVCEAGEFRAGGYLV